MPAFSGVNSESNEMFDPSQDWSIYKATSLLSDSVSLYDDAELFRQVESEYQPPTYGLPPKTIKTEPLAELCPPDVQHYGDWQSKYIDHWTPEDCLFWVIHELHNLKVGRNLPEVKIEKLAHINGVMLKHMSAEEFCQNFPDHGKELYMRLQRFKSPYVYNSMFSVDQWNNPRHEDEYSRYRMEQSQSRTDNHMDTSSPPHESHTLTDLDESHLHTPAFKSSTATAPPYSSPSEVDSGYKSDSSEETTVNEPPPPPEKRRPGRPRGTRRKKKPEKLGRLWEFIRDLLLNPLYNPSLICWENYDEGTFRFVHSDRVAKLWGSKKDNIDMNYEKLSRAMRYYYKSQVLLPVYGKRLVYKFGPTATGWRSERPIFRQG
ncbi:ETS homologous factor-like [Macrosteles quadrilineatus]|uniref:ETS homologous factor-like n=1 Tax=Macrosteles quadrilineatus TaxID=74068 RepID=UPI0023E2637C|nr:ETS homologous factor-like [Macrosteles quadrilineatus]